MLDFLAAHGPAEPLEDGELATPGHYVKQVQDGHCVLLCRTPGAPAIAAVVPVHWIPDPHTVMRWPIRMTQTHGTILLDFIEEDHSVIITRYGGDVAAITPIHHAATKAANTR